MEHQIKNHEVYKQILKDSFGGVMYNMSNQNKYEIGELLYLWHSMTNAEQERTGGIMQGAMNFIQNND